MIWIGSPNYAKGRAGKSINRIVIHWMAGTLAATDNVFQDTNRKTSAHYGIENGVVHQYVSEGDTAYHAGTWDANLRSIGIEHSAQPGRDASEATYRTSAALIADICMRYGLSINANTIIPHRSIVATQCPGTIDLAKLISLAINQGDDMAATKEQLIELYKLAFPNQDVNYDWVKAYTGKDMSDVIQALRDDPSRQSYITALVNDAAAYQSSAKPTELKPGTYRVKKAIVKNINKVIPVSYSKQFIADALERAAKTVAQTAITLLTVDGANLLTLTTNGFISAVILAGILSLLTSVASAGVGDKDSASLVKEVQS
jgi:hypothetical protein